MIAILAKNKIKNSIKKGEIDSAIKSLLKTFQHTKYEDDSIMLSNRWSQLKNTIRNQTLASEEINVERNRISASVLQLIKDSDSNILKEYPFIYYILLGVGLTFIIGILNITDINWTKISIGFVILFFLFVIIFMLYKITLLESQVLYLPAKVLMWFFIISFMFSCSFGVSSIWFKWPIDLQEAVFQDLKDPIESFPKNESFFKPLDQITDMSAKEAPDNSGIRLISDQRKIDFTGVNFNNNDPIKWDRRIKIEKLKTNAEFFKVGYLGGDIKFSETDSIHKILTDHMWNRARTYSKQVYQVIFNIANKPLNTPFSLDLHNLYYQEFNPNKKGKASMKMYGKFDKISIQILMDLNSDFSAENFIWKGWLDEDAKVDTISSENIIQDTLFYRSGETVLVNWEMNNPKFPATYQIEWDWVESE